MPPIDQQLDVIYENRFSGAEEDRARVWQVLTKNFFQRWIKDSDAVLDLGAGYCEFINHIRAGQKYALDLNPVTPQKAAPGVTVLSQSATAIGLPSNSLDAVFSSNFFEHLPDKSALSECLKEVFRLLKPGGRLLALGPNIRFCANVYWDYFDHFIPLSDRSLAEALTMLGFEIEFAVPRFLPYTMKDKKVPPAFLIATYVRVPLLWRVMGQQFFLVARKPD